MNPSFPTGTEEPFSPTESDPSEPYLFLVLQAHQPLAPPARFSMAGLRKVSIGRASRFEVDRDIAKQTLYVGVEDSWMSARHLELQLLLGRWVAKDIGSHNGSLINQTPLDSAALNDADLLEAGRTFFIFRQSLPPIENLPADVTASQLTGPEGLHTLLPDLSRRFSALESVATSNVSVIIQGQSGTGKELAARALHQRSGRSGPMVAVNCASIPVTLAESELFGYEKGAFSGANERRLGLLRAADRGTLFLDEIADLSPLSQANLLRVLQERQVLPLGAVRPVPVDLRVCAATHRDLPQRVARQEFREDLWARLRGFTLQLPSLLERREDLGLLLRALLKRFVRHSPEQLSVHRRAARALFEYDWPLNIRELEKCLEAALALSRGGQIRPEHLPVPIVGAPASSATSMPVLDKPDPSQWDQTLREELIRLLTDHSGNIAAVARAIGKQPTQVRRWARRFQLSLHQYRERSGDPPSE